MLREDRSYTEEVMHWLNRRFLATNELGYYVSHEPIYGYAGGPSEPDKLSRLSRIFQILQLVNKLDFESFVDVGGGEGFWSNIIAQLFQVPRLTCDLSFQANLMAKNLYNLESLTLDACDLPIRDKAFDLVMCSETLEHIPDAAKAVRELVRISRKYVLITTPWARSREQQRRCVRSTDQHQLHRHLHHFTEENLRNYLGENTYSTGLRSKLMHPVLIWLEGVNTRSRIFLNDDVIEALLRLDSGLSMALPSFALDILVVKTLGEDDASDLRNRRGRLSNDALLRFLVRENRVRPFKMRPEVSGM